MIKLVFTMAKLGVLAVVIMLIGQIPVGSKRICDHVADVTHSRFVMGPVLWISDKFDFSDGRRHIGPGTKAVARADRSTESKRTRSATGSSQNESTNSERLSGLLKRL